MEEVYVNVEYTKSGDSTIPTNQTGLRSSKRRYHGAVVLCLGLLSVFLLAGLIGLGVHYHGSVHRLAAELSAIKANLSEHLQISDKFSSLTEERDLLKANLLEMTKERDKLQWLLQQKTTCPTGWTNFSCSCYLFSDESGSWDQGRENCRARGADLVVIDSPKEQEFLLGFTSRSAWIGLSDRDEEGTWKWVDKTPLNLTVTAKYWRVNQPDNGNGEPQWGEEDCANISSDGWNDLSCDASLRWICEKMA
ncbi:CD209 antigen-like protein C isoform X3 [Lates calcarifer]|uniref:CD209 antigen-like protein C isoform X3 n=1 Tax=Lates calcarifer TaxID=8187 RepID=A0AAJ7L8W8_LATCA|nr:CD209 antigen-like protein C isoform X3 [Lates calcarifer]